MNLTSDEVRIIRAIAKYFATRWRKIDVEDLTSELNLWAYQNYETLAEWRTEPMGEGKLYVSLRRAAAKYCARETQKYSVNPIDQNNYYTKEQIERILPYIWEQAPESNAINPEESNLAVSIISDIRSAFYALKKEDRQLLEIRYRLELSQSEIGELLGLSDRGAEKRIQRALDRLHDSLGGDPPII